MYDPSIGRWLEEDPLGFEAGDANLYRYVGNGPTTSVDPEGLDENKVDKVVAKNGVNYTSGFGKPIYAEQSHWPAEIKPIDPIFQPNPGPTSSIAPPGTVVLELANGSLVYYPTGSEPAYLPPGSILHRPGRPGHLGSGFASGAPSYPEPIQGPKPKPTDNSDTKLTIPPPRDTTLGRGPWEFRGWLRR